MMPLPTEPTGGPRRIFLLLLLLSALAVLVWSGLFPSGRFNWLMEVFPALIALPILLLTYRRFPLTPLTYTLIWMFSLILMVGGHYTYARVPIGNWARDTFHLSRNHFDRLGHLFQGIVPAMLMRELLLRTSPLRQGKWLGLLCIAFAMMVSSCYELFEWQYAVRTGGERAEDFLGSQGDIWDTQKDMCMALIGSALAVLLLSRWQDRQLRQLDPTTGVSRQPGPTR